MPNTTNFNFPTPADSDLVKDGALAIRNLANSIDTAFVDLKGGTTGQVLSKNSNTDLDYAWVAQDDSNAIQNAIIDAKGDLIVGTAADTPARLAVGGTNGHVLTVDSGEASGIKWAAVAAGGMTLISETVASALSSLSFSSLGSYKQLLLVWSGIVHSGTGSDFSIRFNNDSTASIYQSEGIRVAGNSLQISGASGDSLKSESGGSNIFPFGTSTNLDAGSQTLSNGFILIDNYTSSTKFKTIDAKWSYYNNASDTYLTANCIFVYQSQTAITSLDIVRLSGSQTFSNKTNTTIRLYGVS